MKAHNLRQTNKIVRYVGKDPGRFKSLIDIYLEGPYRVTQRASWSIGKCIETHPPLVGPHLKRLLDFQTKPGVHDAVKRNTMRLLQYIDIPKRNHDQVLSLCFNYLQEKNLAVAIKVFSMSVLTGIIRDKPELQQELRIILEDQFHYSSAAFRSRARKVLKAISPAA